MATLTKLLKRKVPCWPVAGVEVLPSPHTAKGLQWQQPVTAYIERKELFRRVANGPPSVRDGRRSRQTATAHRRTLQAVLYPLPTDWVKLGDVTAAIIEKLLKEVRS